jgi:S-adenosyl methyltransferase
MTRADPLWAGLRGCAGRGSIARDKESGGKAGQVTSGQGPAGEGVSFDTSRAHMARVYDFWLGGKDNFAADRAVAEQVAAAYPEIRAAVRAQRAFLARAVHFLVAEEGIRQFLDIGTGLPSADNTTRLRSGRRRRRGWCTWTTTRSCSATPGPC